MRRYRSTGSDPLFGDPRRAHCGVSMEGYFWRITDPETGRVIRLGDPVISPVTTTTADEEWRLSGRGFGWRIEVEASAPLDQAFVLPVPLPSEHRNTPGDLEHLVGDLEVTVSRFGKHVWTGTTSLAALEHGGLDRARAELRRRGLDDTLTHAPPSMPIDPDNHGSIR